MMASSMAKLPFRVRGDSRFALLATIRMWRAFVATLPDGPLHAYGAAEGPVAEVDDHLADLARLFGVDGEAERAGLI